MVRGQAATATACFWISDTLMDRPWQVSGTRVSTLLRAGWTPTTIKYGDKVKMSVHPLRNGDAGGNFISLTLPDGKVMTLNAQQ